MLDIPRKQFPSLPPKRRTLSSWSVILFSAILILLLLFPPSKGEEEWSDQNYRAAIPVNKRTRKLLLKLFRRKIKIPEHSSLSLAAQVSRPNIWPGIFNQEDGFIVDAVVEVPSWLDLDDFAEAMYGINSTGNAKSGSFVGTERCFLYEKLEWLLTFLAQISGKMAHACVLKFICETQAIHTFYPDYPISIAFELIHLVLTPSLGTSDPCFRSYVAAEEKGKIYGRCDKYDKGCPFSVGGIWIQNFFPGKTLAKTNPAPIPIPSQVREPIMWNHKQNHKQNDYFQQNTNNYNSHDRHAANGDNLNRFSYRYDYESTHNLQDLF